MRATSLVDVGYVSTSPRLAQKVAEGVGDSFIRLNNEKKFESVNQASDFLERQIAQIRADIEVTRRETAAVRREQRHHLHRRREQHSVPAVGEARTADLQNATTARVEKQNAYDTLVRRQSRVGYQRATRS